MIILKVNASIAASIFSMLKQDSHDVETFCLLATAFPVQPSTCATMVLPVLIIRTFSNPGCFLSLNMPGHAFVFIRERETDISSDAEVAVVSNGAKNDDIGLTLIPHFFLCATASE